MVASRAAAAAAEPPEVGACARSQQQSCGTANVSQPRQGGVQGHSHGVMTALAPGAAMPAARRPRRRASRDFDHLIPLVEQQQLLQEDASRTASMERPVLTHHTKTDTLQPGSWPPRVAGAGGGQVAGVGGATSGRRSRRLSRDLDGALMPLRIVETVADAHAQVMLAPSSRSSRPSRDSIPDVIDASMGAAALTAADARYRSRRASRDLGWAPHVGPHGTFAKVQSFELPADLEPAALKQRELRAAQKQYPHQQQLPRYLGHGDCDSDWENAPSMHGERGGMVAQ
jgi:hypothetical protein